MSVKDYFINEHEFINYYFYQKKKKEDQVPEELDNLEMEAI